MNNAMYFITALNDLPDAYLLAAHEEGKRHSRRRLVLIAAVAAALLLAGCAAYAYHWYTTYFSLRREEPLSDSQVEYIDENAQNFSNTQAQTHGGYTVSLETAISDGNIAYLTFGITAPEGVDLSQYLAGKDNPSIVWGKMYATVAENESYAQSMGISYCDDGDGKDNTVYMVLTIEPNLEQQPDLTFGSEMQWKIVLEDITEWGYDKEYEQELLSTKYAGQTDYMFTDEESARIRPFTTLAEGTWEFQVTLDFADLEQLELLTAPIQTKGVVTWKGEGEGIFYETYHQVENITITSVRLYSLGVSIDLVQPTPEDQNLGVCLNLSEYSSSLDVDVSEDEAIFVMLKDGTRIDFWQFESARTTAYLRADSPIAMEEVDYLQLSDGTQLRLP